MLKSTTIDKVREIPVEQVIKKYVELKKSGSSLKGLSPFTEEKSPSFIVSISKNLWKCFSTGKGGGDGISFIMEHQAPCSFIDAVKIIANDHGIDIEYEDTAKAQKIAETQNKLSKIYAINSAALDFFTENIKTTPKNIRKRASKEMEGVFALGFAKDSYHGLLDHLVNLGFSKQLMVDAGLITYKNEKYYDFLRNRVIFPVFNQFGNVIGFSGRSVVDDKKIPKTMNTRETIAYTKSKSLLGLYQAKEGIMKTGYATLVEGNHDVTSCFEKGMNNTLGSLGSAVTDDHCKLIKRYTNEILLFRDNDKAGNSKIETDVHTFLNNGFKVFIFVPTEDGWDPDDFMNKYEDGDPVEFVKNEKRDAVEYLADQFFSGAESVLEKNTAMKKLVELLAIISDAPLRNSYVAEFASRYKISKKDVETSVQTVLIAKNVEEAKAAPDYRIPDHVAEEDRKDWEDYGFYSDRKKESIGYYFPSANFKFERISNFVLTPLFHVEAKQDSNRYAEVQNLREKKVIEIPNKAFVSLQKFDEVMTDRGVYWFNGTNKHFQKLRAKLLAQFPRVEEIKTLGWQEDGFWSFSDGVVDNGQFRPINDHGIININKKDFFLPAFSSVFKNFKGNNDHYHNDKYAKYRASGITVSKWSHQFIEVYKNNDNGIWGVLFFISSLFRDYIHGSLSLFPLLFAHGQPQTGKTTMAISLSRIFFGEKIGFNLNQGTRAAFWNTLAQTRNSIIWFEEYTNDLIDERFQALKGIFDGTGHEKAKLSRDNRTESTRPESTAVITSQFIPSRDDNSLATRSILLAFDKKLDDFTDKEIKEYEKLKSWEETGLSDLIIEVIKYRDLVEAKFLSEFSLTESELKKSLEGKKYVGRTLKVYSLLMTMLRLLGPKLSLPFDYESTLEKATNSILMSSALMADSDALRSYWKMIQFLSIEGHIQHNVDYKIEIVKQVSVRIDGEKGTKKMVFPGGLKVIFLQLSRIHPLYEDHYMKRYREKGFPEGSIRSFMKTNKAFFGNIPKKQFKDVATSAYVFDYEMLEISLVGENFEELPKPQNHG